MGVVIKGFTKIVFDLNLKVLSNLSKEKTREEKNLGKNNKIIFLAL